MTTQYPSLDQLLATVADLHPLTAVGTRVLEMTQGGRFSAQELGWTISSDPALSAKMLRLCNSAYYGSPREIMTVREAVVMLGFNTVRSATLASCVIDSFRGSRLIAANEFWRFSIAVGMLAEMSARCGGIRDPEEAFTAGVVHNIGLLTLDQYLPDALRDSIKHANSEHVSLHVAERRLLGFSDSQLGGAVALHWNFPQPLVDAIAGHGLQLLDLPDGEDSLLRHVVWARRYARSLNVPGGLSTEVPESAAEVEVSPPVMAAVVRKGGPPGVLSQAEAFMAATRS